MDELQSLKQALSFLLEQEELRRQEIVALNEKIESIKGFVDERATEIGQWADDRDFNDFSNKYNEKLSPYAEKMGKIHPNYDLIRDTYDAYKGQDEYGEDDFVGSVTSALDAYLEDIGIPAGTAVEVVADMDGDGDPETVVAEENTEPAEGTEPTEPTAEKTEEPVENEEDKAFMDSINKAVDKELAKK